MLQNKFKTGLTHPSCRLNEDLKELSKRITFAQSCTWLLFLQALVNMAEILKAAGCGYTNGERALPFFACAQDNSFNFSTTDPIMHYFLSFLVTSWSCQNHSALSRYERLHQCQWRVQAMWVSMIQSLTCISMCLELSAAVGFHFAIQR